MSCTGLVLEAAEGKVFNNIAGVKTNEMPPDARQRFGLSPRLINAAGKNRFFHDEAKAELPGLVLSPFILALIYIAKAWQ